MPKRRLPLTLDDDLRRRIGHQQAEWGERSLNSTIVRLLESSLGYETMVNGPLRELSPNR